MNVKKGERVKREFIIQFSNSVNGSVFVGVCMRAVNG